ncbi:MAG: seryl-tRNA synthetase, seryl-tRNA synthetase [Parcubacteria group bacterium GW2011_GWC1_36_108]|nr:MAG: seryl-tRNA synthetase, seryl-tRNA synthetase [Parcubacteria group bacterium GW2011_GWC1_36_108]
MLDIKFIRENKEKIADAAEKKGIDLNLVELLELDKKRLSQLQYIEELQAEKNKLNELLPKADAEEKIVLLEQAKAVKEKLATAEPEFKIIKDAFDELMVKVPNIISGDTPIGKSDEDNVEIERNGEIPKFDFEIKDHVQLGKDLDILDLEKGTKVAGFRGYYMKNEGASLMMALMMYAMNKLIEKGYSPMIPPTLVKGSALFGTGYFKGKEYDSSVDEVYEVASGDKEADGKSSKEKKFLVGTAEPSLLAYYSDEVLKEEQLPIKIVGYSQCYRSEIGSYGKDTKGFYRVHEFMKVEQVVLMAANEEESIKMHDDMLEISKEVHAELGLPYRVLKICSGDMSAGKFRAYDIEAWMPSRDNFGETGSASNFLDWQARRLNVKYVDKNGDKKHVYMLNNTVLPSPRPFIAILENFQQADGSVLIPEVLRKYMPGGVGKITPKV